MVLVPFLLLAVLMLGDAWPLAQPGSAFGDKQGNHRHLSDAAATATASDASLYDVVIMVGPSEATIACTVLRAIRKHAQGARRIIALSPSDPLTTSLKAEGRDASGKGLWGRKGAAGSSRAIEGFPSFEWVPDSTVLTFLDRQVSTQLLLCSLLLLLLLLLL